MKRQQKLTFFIEKRRAVEPPVNDEEGPEKDGERSEENGRSQLYEPTASATTTTVRKFRPVWQKTFPWLQYDEQKDLMLSAICLKQKKNNAFTKGTNNFRFSTLERHMAHHGHADALKADAMQGE